MKGQTLATVYDKDWFLVTNNIAELKTMLDRVDGRLKDRAATLAGDATFSAAFKHIPSSYAVMIYGRLDRYIEKVMPLLEDRGTSTAGNQPIYRQMHAFCGGLSFEGGKMRDVLFVGMPQAGRRRTFDAKLTHTRDKGDILLSGELSEFIEPNDVAGRWTSRFRNCRDGAEGCGSDFKYRRDHGGMECGVRTGAWGAG